MDPKPPSAARDRPGTGSFRAGTRAAGKFDPRDSQGATTLPPTVGVGTLDNVRSVFWQAWRHLFPPHSLAAQTSNGNLVISWSVLDDPHAHHPYAAPVLLRFDADLLDAMRMADARTRIRIALNHEPTLREGLRGYDPFARFPNARVINIG
ncbi:MAG: hypothetical protein EOO30_10770 [Comamonadaceae bacterium]|nr:MAG: hypothetical protein EOO30_10770 [Comamonadaceae bacterium]